VIDAQTDLAQREAQLRQQQLVAEVVRPAEADAERTRVLAKAEADRIRIQAEAAASHNRVALDRMLIDQLPQIVREAAAGLQGADITVLNGAEGLSEIAAGLVSQGLAIFETVRHNLSPVDTPSGALGEPTASPQPKHRAQSNGSGDPQAALPPSSESPEG
jgi:flotillin